MTPQERHEARMAAIERALRETAREAGCTAGALRCVWYYHDRASQNVARAGRFMGGKPAKPTGLAYAIRDGLVQDIERREWLGGVFRSWPITPEGRRALWRLHERLAEVSP